MPKLLSAVRIFPAVFPALLLGAAVLGCGRGAPDMDSPRRQVEGAVAELADMASDPQRFAEKFVAGAAPDDKQRSRFGFCMFQAKSVSISGDSATALVQVDDVHDNPLGEVEWKLVKEGGEWKFQAAPLP